VEFDGNFGLREREGEGEEDNHSNTQDYIQMDNMAAPAD
jgi:hypothetical protein